jgi:hypothetical protein
MRGNRRLIFRGVMGTVVAALLALTDLVGGAAAHAVPSGAPAAVRCQAPKTGKAKKAAKKHKKSLPSSTTTSTTESTPGAGPVAVAGQTTTSSFAPKFSIVVPATGGWTKDEIQGLGNVAFLEASTDAITPALVFFNLSPSTQAQVIAKLNDQATPGYTFTQPVASCLGTVPAQTLDVSASPGGGPLLTGGGPLFPVPYSLPSGGKGRLWIATVQGSAVVVLAQAGSASFDMFASQAAGIVQSVRFS